MVNFEDIGKGQVQLGDYVPGKFSFRVLLKFIGPGFLISMAYLDPGNLAGDLDAARDGGYHLLWVLLLATIAGLTFQIRSARLGVVTGMDLAKICRTQFNCPTTIALWIFTEIAIIGSDIQEVLGSAIALKILFGLPLYAGALITMVDTFTFLILQVYGIRKLEFFFAILISVLGVCFYVNMFIISPPIDKVLGGFIPYIPAGAGQATIGLIGSVIMPHNIYLHSALVQSRDVDLTCKVKTQDANMYFAVEAGLSLFISFAINVSVISVFAYWQGSSELDGLESASYALNSFGSAAGIIWAVGLLAAGQSSTMTGTYAGQFVMQGFLDLKIVAWKRILLTRSLAIMPALCIAFLDTPDLVVNQLNILQSIQLPFALIPVLKFTASSEIMGDFCNSKLTNWTCGFISAGLILMNLMLLVPAEASYQMYFVLTTAGICYVSFIFFVLTRPVVPLKKNNSKSSVNDLAASFLPTSSKEKQ